MSSDEHFSLRLSDSESENQTDQKLMPSPVFGGKKTVKRFNRNPAKVRIKFVKNCAKELVRNPVYNEKNLVRGWSKNCRQVLSKPISKQQKAAVETTNTIRTSSELRILENAEVHNKTTANNQLAASPAKREIQLNVSPQCLSKNDDAKRTEESPQKQLSTEIFESEEAEVIRLERPIKNLSTVTNKTNLADNVYKNISEISNVDSRKSQLNSNSNSSAELSECAIYDYKKTSDSSAEFLGFKNPVQSFLPKVADIKRQVLKNTITTSSGKHLSTNRKYVPSNFKWTEKEEKNFPLSSSSDSSTEFLGFQNTCSERSSKRDVPTNNNYVSSDFVSVQKKNQNISEINNSSQKSYCLRSNRNKSYFISESSDSSLELTDSSTELLGFKKLFHTDEISYSKKNHDDKNIPSSSSSDSSTKILGWKTICSQRNLPTNQNNVSSDFESVIKKNKNISLNYSSDSSTEFSGFVKITSTPKNRSLKRRRYCKSSSSDESDDSSPNDRNRFTVRNIRKNKRRKLIRTSSSSDSEDIVHIPRNSSKSSSTLKTKSSSTKKNYPRSVNSAKSDVNVTRRRKEEKIKKLRKYFKNINVDLHRQKYFWRDCQLNVDKVLKWIQNQKNIHNLIEDPRALQRKIEVYLENLELNTRSIISLNKRVTRSQTAKERWQHYLKYGKTVKWPEMKNCEL